MSQALRKLTGIVSKSRTCIVFIKPDPREDRRDVAIPKPPPAGALKFYSSIRVDIRRIAAIKEGDLVVGIAHQSEDREEQDRRPLPRGRVRHHVRRSISREGDMLDLAAIHNIVEKSGSWFSFRAKRIGRAARTPNSSSRQ